MQWQRVFHGLGGAVAHAGRLHALYEFTVPQFPGQMIRIKVVETPEGGYYALPDHQVVFENGKEAQLTTSLPEITAENALRNSLQAFTNQLAIPVKMRLQRLQYW